VDLIGEICQIKEVIPDEYLYAGGLSMMGIKQFLNPYFDRHIYNYSIDRISIK
jgi:hypothetical protein